MKKLVVLLTVIAISAILYALNFFMLHDDLQNRGSFGDMFGFSNSIFSGLAFIGVLYTIILQIEQVKIQKEELELTRNELIRSADAQEQSEIHLRDQALFAKLNARITVITSLRNAFNEELNRLHNLSSEQSGAFGKIQYGKKIEESKNKIESLDNELTCIYQEIMPVRKTTNRQETGQHE